MSRLAKAARILVINLLVLYGLSACVEGFFFVLLRRPALLYHFPVRVRNIVRDLYMVTEMSVIQYMPACARWDPALGYTLRPGTCVFSNHEFKDTFSINSLGVRDSEEALDRPEIAVLGDSHSMGWGVPQDLTFAKLLEKKTGKKVLNTGVAGYGTAREMMMLSRMKKDGLSCVIIQYYKDDYDENLTFLKNHGVYTPMTRLEYARCTRYGSPKGGYFPGKYLYVYAMRMLLERKVRRMEGGPPTGDEAAGAFLGVLSAFGKELSGVRLIVFETNELGIETGFTESLKKRAASGNLPSGIKNVTVLDWTKIVDKKNDFWPLDGHLNQSGHRHMAQALAKALGWP
jgi:hypothetical protein